MSKNSNNQELIFCEVLLYDSLFRSGRENFHVCRYINIQESDTMTLHWQDDNFCYSVFRDISHGINFKWLHYKKVSTKKQQLHMFLLWKLIHENKKWEEFTKSKIIRSSFKSSDFESSLPIRVKINNPLINSRSRLTQR